MGKYTYKRLTATAVAAMKRMGKEGMFWGCKQGSVVTTANKVREVFGMRTYFYPHYTVWKTRYEWLVLVCDGKGNEWVATIYDWKQYRRYPLDENITFNISGNDLPQDAVDEIVNMLK